MELDLWNDMKGETRDDSATIPKEAKVRNQEARGKREITLGGWLVLRKRLSSNAKYLLTKHL